MRKCRCMRHLAIAMLALAIVVSPVATPANAGAGYFRAKPSGITCGAFRLHKRSATIRCDLPFLGSRAAFLHLRGRGAIQHVSSFLHPHRPLVLHQGETRRFGAFLCTSRSKTVSCRSGDGHGFTVGHGFQLVF